MPEELSRPIGEGTRAAPHSASFVLTLRSAAEPPRRLWMFEPLEQHSEIVVAWRAVRTPVQLRRHGSKCRSRRARKPLGRRHRVRRTGEADETREIRNAGVFPSPGFE